ncbi:MAG TPA: hypothetical protein VKB47_01780, partial [Terracidiphilus sp.]|nr:hypothetical protein [Terracidiphilus sp.]
HAQFIGFFFEQLLQPSIDRLHKHRASIFGTMRYFSVKTQPLFFLYRSLIRGKYTGAAQLTQNERPFAPHALSAVA